MGHHIDKFGVERSGDFIRLVVGDDALLLGQEEARRVADALEQAKDDALVFSGETGEHMVLRIGAKPIGDRLISIEVRTPVLGVHATLIAKALKEEAAKSS
jgi:hypothetical protein